MVKIVTVPSDILRKVAAPVVGVDTRILELLKDMQECLKKAKDPQGVGLAAPQVGVSLRLFLSRPVKNGAIHTFINPEITDLSQKTIDPHKKDGVYEGCLSIPAHYSPIRRSYAVTVKYQVIKDGQLVTKEETLTGFAAHVVQHEMDHLNGVLFIDRALAQNEPIYKIEGDEWVEVGI